ncbi:MAG: hypothetical protein WDN47_04340 [Candidatus Doudnabacteria bacterium]
MKRLYWEILFGALFVLAGSFLAYRFLSGYSAFWTAQKLWSLILVVGYVFVAGGYWRQGAIIHRAKNATNVSLILPSAVFVVQCIIFVKGIYYHDAALVTGAILVNSAVVFDIYQIIRAGSH